MASIVLARYMRPMVTPDVIDDLTTSCRRFVEQALSIELDGTPDTLPLLDHYLSLLRDDPHREDVTGMVVPAVGAYFGQVARGLLDDGAWHCPVPEEGLPEYASWRIIFERRPVTFNPLGIAVECAVQSDASGWGGHFELPPAQQELAARYMETVGEQIRSDDYYRLSVRLEVLESLYSLALP